MLSTKLEFLWRKEITLSALITNQIENWLSNISERHRIKEILKWKMHLKRHSSKLDSTINLDMGLLKKTYSRLLEIMNQLLLMDILKV